MVTGRGAGMDLWFALLMFVSRSMIVVAVEFVKGDTAPSGNQLPSNPLTVPHGIDVGNANSFVDEAIVHWRLIIRESGYDPLEVPSFRKESINCWNCKIEGLSTIKRSGDVTLNATQAYLVVDLNLGLDSVTAKCDCEAKWSFLSVSGIINGHLTEYSIAGRLEQHANNRRIPTLSQLKVTNEGHLSTHFDGNGILGTLVQWFGQDIIRNRVKELIANEKQMREFLNKGLTKVDLTKALSFF